MTTPNATIIDFPAPRRRREAWRGMKLAENIAHFVRTLRRAGMAVGPAAVLDCVEASREIDLGNRDEFYHALASCLVKRPEDRLLFDQAFHIFWRNPRLLEKMRDLLLPTLAREGESEEASPTARRVEEALRPDAPPPESAIEDSERVEIDMSMTSSADEHFRSMDFQQMSVAEIAEAEHVVDMMRLPLPH
ncbi:MAG: VWA domain-containing protein, partial [Rhodobiaceae bacterium]